ncbi:MAG: hypothetical protein R3F29_00965 [Planctomycetota bacterium]
MNLSKQRQVLFVLVSAVLGAVFGYTVGLRVGVALAPRGGMLLVPAYEVWPAAMIGAVLGVAVFVPLLWVLRGRDLPPAAWGLAPGGSGPTSSPSPTPASSTVPPAATVIAPAKAVPGTYMVATVRGALIGAVLGLLASLIGVVFAIGPQDKWFSAFALVFGQLGAAIGAVVGGVFEPLRVRRKARRLGRS